MDESHRANSGARFHFVLTDESIGFLETPIPLRHELTDRTRAAPKEADFFPHASSAVNRPTGTIGRPPIAGKRIFSAPKFYTAPTKKTRSSSTRARRFFCCFRGIVGLETCV